jgi:hypothetical protein
MERNYIIITVGMLCQARGKRGLFIKYLMQPYLHLFYCRANEPVEKVTFLRTASSVGSRIENHHFL